MMAPSPYRSLSLWHDTLPDDTVSGTGTPRQPRTGDIEADVAIVGAGFTGLWTAYYLSRADPAMRVVVCEREIAGFGASGRNGGWCSALFPASLSKLERMAGRDSAIAMQRAMHDAVDEVGRVAAAEGIDCHFTKVGTVLLARSPAQVARARAVVAGAREFGFGEADVRLLTAAQAREMAGASQVLGGVYTPHCSAIHPARLVAGLADTVRRAGVQVFERTPVLQIEPRRLTTSAGTVSARYVIRATEGYTPQLPGLERAIAPVYSLMIATAPLPESAWAEIGLTGRPTFGDLRHLIIYGQRT
ncbi:MAG: NAD(P)/FAD-dependent oxidoreductase, partial [Streptosporangiaceae bacterium]